MDDIIIVVIAQSIAAPGTEGVLIGTSIAAYILPGSLSSAVLARHLASVSNKTVIVLDSYIRLALFVCLAAAWFTATLGGLLLVAILAVGGFTQSLGRAALSASVRDLVEDDERLFSANSLFASTSQVATLLGPALAGVLIAVTNPGVALLANAATFLVLAWAATVIPRMRSSETSPTPPNGNHRSARKSSRALWILVITALFFFFYGPMVVGLPLRIESLSADQSENATRLGLAWSALGAGSLLGTALAGGRRQLATCRTLGMIVMLWGITTAMVGLGSEYAIIAGAMFFGGFTYAPYSAIVATIMQTEMSRPEFIATNSRYVAVASIGTPAGMFVAGLLTAAVSPMTLLTGSALGLGVVGIIALVTAPMPAATRSQNASTDFDR